ncbi:MAG: HlyC/CorC family transporter [Pseudomonadota bacterium]
MSHFDLVVSSCVLVLLIFLSGFFSIAETALMAVNRYRLRHKARQKKRTAILILKLLKRPDRLLGMILIGNNLANIVASALATLIALKLWGDKGVVISTACLTLLVLIFAEIAPKTFAALYPDKVSRFVAFPVYIALTIFFPLVWFINTITNGLLRAFHINVRGHAPLEQLSREELRSVVFDTAGKMSRHYQTMLLGILDLNKVTVDDVMIPRHYITGIDVEQPWDDVKQQLSRSPHAWMPIYREHINDVVGILHVRELTGKLLLGGAITRENLMKLAKEPYFVPVGTPLNIQLLNFQQLRKRLALVVDEYGEVMGLVTLEDILEEIVGEFTTNVISTAKINLQPDGSYLVDGSIMLRELNRVTKWKFPTNGPRSLNGLIVEYLEALPKAGVCMLINDHPLEIVQVKENSVKQARIFPKWEKKGEEDEKS